MSREYLQVVFKARDILFEVNCAKFEEPCKGVTCDCMSSAKKIVDLVLNTEFTEIPIE